MKMVLSLPKLLTISSLLALCVFSTNCATRPTSAKKDSSHVMEVSVPQQKMALYRHGNLVKTYPVSTSKFGLGNEKGSYRTPLGKMEVKEKIGHGKPAGAVFKSRKWTGEILKPNAPGRDPIVSRILWLNGLEPKNKNTYSRCIYIHGTAAERSIGKAASYGCVRMKSKDVIDLFNRVGEGSTVYIVKKGLWKQLQKEQKERETEQAKKEVVIERLQSSSSAPAKSSSLPPAPRAPMTQPMPQLAPQATSKPLIMEAQPNPTSIPIFRPIEPINTELITH